jgi:glucuronokinase
VGLAGSSALAVGVIDATSSLWQVDLDRRVIAALALSAERDVLGIAAGWQDRIVQSFGRTVLVDAARMDVVDGLQVPHVRLPSAQPGVLGSLVVAWADHAASPSGDYHSKVRLAGEALDEPMADLAELARRATASLERGELADVAAALDAAWSIRQRCAPLHPDHAALVEAVRDHGVAATTPGSGGSVVALCLDDSAVADAVGAVQQAGCSFICLPLARDRD